MTTQAQGGQLERQLYGRVAEHPERPEWRRRLNVGFLSFSARTGLAADGPQVAIHLGDTWESARARWLGAA